MIDHSANQTAIETKDTLGIMEGYSQWAPYNPHQLKTGKNSANTMDLHEFTSMWGLRFFLMQYLTEKEADRRVSRISNIMPKLFTPRNIKRTEEKCPTFFKNFPALVDAKIQSAKKRFSAKKKKSVSQAKLNIPPTITNKEQTKTNNSLSDCLIEENSILESAIFNPKSSHINDIVSLRKEGATSIKYEQNGSTTKYEIQF